MIISDLNYMETVTKEASDLEGGIAFVTNRARQTAIAVGGGVNSNVTAFNVALQNGQPINISGLF